MLFPFSVLVQKKHVCTNCKFTLEYGSILDDEMFELSADNLQARLHVAACSYLIPLLHLLRTAGRAFGLADLQICACQEISRDKTEV